MNPVGTLEISSPNNETNNVFGWVNQFTTSVNTTDSNALKKIITDITNDCYSGVTKVNVEEQFLMKSHMKSISTDESQWLVGHYTEGIPCLIIVWFGNNYVVNLETNVYLRLNVPFIHTDTYDKTIIKGTLSAPLNAMVQTDLEQTSAPPEGKLYFVAEQSYISCGENLMGCNFDKRHKSLYQFKYNSQAQIVYVIMTLLKIKHIRCLLKDYNFPFKVNGLKFIELVSESPKPMYIWKRTHDITLNFLIKVADDKSSSSDNPQAMFMLLNCKKPTFTINNPRYASYNGQVVEAMHHDSQWLITNVTQRMVSNLTTYKQVNAFIKENIQLDTICDTLAARQ